MLGNGLHPEFCVALATQRDSIQLNHLIQSGLSLMGRMQHISEICSLECRGSINLKAGKLNCFGLKIS